MRTRKNWRNMTNRFPESSAMCLALCLQPTAKSLGGSFLLDLTTCYIIHNDFWICTEEKQGGVNTWLGALSLTREYFYCPL